MGGDFQKPLQLLSAYGYCAFKNNICGDRPEILDGMPDSSNPLLLEFFDNRRCPPTLVDDKAIDVEVSQGGAVGDSEGGVVAKC